MPAELKDKSLAWAQHQDAIDPLASFRGRFHLPLGRHDQPVVYLCGNSLGLQPHGVRQALEQELDDWAQLGVDGHFEARLPWYDYHEFLREDAAAVVGAQPFETVVMNSLTVNLHLMLASFYRPAGERTIILMEGGAFPSDRYAVETHLTTRGYRPNTILEVIDPRPDEPCIREDDLRTRIQQLGNRLALVLLGGVHYYTGQVFPLQDVTTWAHQVGALAGFDLAHAAGNLPLKLHDWDVDFAIWCSYKYLNGGPGAVGGCFVHERHGQRPDLPRLAGWWGNDPGTRFTMPDQFMPQAGAAGWQISNAPVLSMAALMPSLEMFREAGMPALRHKAEQLTSYMAMLLSDLPVDIITPVAARGCQLSLRLGPGAKRACDALRDRDVVADYRSPDVLRVAAVPLYNTFADVWHFVQHLKACL